MLRLLAMLIALAVISAWKTPLRKVKSVVTAAALSLSLFTPLEPSHAAIDCESDCYKNCVKVAPGSGDYCKASCKDYCEQDDRTDGLSGSISNTGGETGIFGGSPVEGGSSVTRGQDRPPNLVKILPDSLLKVSKIKST
jgi:hypothetical protein